MNNQRGVSLLGVIIVGFFLFLAVVVGVKVAPEYIEYYKILKDVKAVAQDSSLAGASPNDLRAAFAKRCEVDHIKDFAPKDLDVVKQGNGAVISFSYNRIVPLFANVSLLIEFEGSSAGN